MDQPNGGSLRVTYLVRARAGEIAARAEALMLEQAVELPRAEAARDSWIAAHILGCVEDIRPAGDDLFHVTITQPLATTAHDPAQLLDVLFGNSSLQPDVVLMDVDLPDSAFDWLPGPASAAPGCGRSPASAAGRCSPPRSSPWGSGPPSSQRCAPPSRARASTS